MNELLAWYWLSEDEVLAFARAGFTSEQRRRLAALRRKVQWEKHVGWRVDSALNLFQARVIDP